MGWLEAYKGECWHCASANVSGEVPKPFAADANTDRGGNSVVCCYALRSTVDRVGHAHPVECGADDAAGVASAFAAGEESADFRMLQGIVAARDADG